MTAHEELFRAVSRIEDPTLRLELNAQALSDIMEMVKIHDRLPSIRLLEFIVADTARASEDLRQQFRHAHGKAVAVRRHAEATEAVADDTPREP